MPNKGFTHELSYEGKTNDWLTPPSIIHSLGEFDLDPCASQFQPWATAQKQYTVEDDGLSKEWQGRVWCNPPYGPHVGIWMERMAKHGNGIALIFARTETKSFKKIWETCSGILFLFGRIKFYKTDGTEGAHASAPSVLVAWGDENLQALRECGLPGALVTNIEVI